MMAPGNDPLLDHHRSRPGVRTGWEPAPDLTLSETAPAVARGGFGRWLLLVAAVIGGLAIIIGGIFGLWVLRQVNPPGAPQAARTFVVSADESLASVATRLKHDGFITHAGVFEWYVKRKGGLHAVAGYYTLRPKDTMGNLLAALRRAPNATFTSVTFPEGFTVAQMAKRLADKVPHFSPVRFEAATTDGAVSSAYVPSSVHSLEGLLFPDTYQVSNAESEVQVVARMVALAERVGRQEGIDDPLHRSGLTPYQIYIVASLIEREAKFDVDRAKIARVIYNRLALGMPLQIDASLRYDQDPTTPFATLKALDTAYNTYLHTGLPPTPIANPGRASLRAALNPAVDPAPGDPLCVGLSAKQSCHYLY